MSNQTKYEGRKKALQLLGEQLSRGNKSVSKGIKPFDGTKRDNEGKRLKLDTLPLTAEEKSRIEKQMENLQNKIENYDLRLLTNMMENLKETSSISSPVHKVSRPKNPKTKLYKFIQGAYQKVSSVKQKV